MGVENIKILAIDDSQDNLTALKAVIEDAFPGVRILTALNGADGIELAGVEDPDVILLDIVMPAMDGYEVCRKLKADERLRHIPIVFLTALKTDRDSHIKALEEGAEGFISKPFEITELTAQIRAMAKIKKASELQLQEKGRLAALVAERTRELEQELAERRKAGQELQKANQQLQLNQIATLNLLEDLKKEIEARKQSEAALGESERRLATLVANLPGMAYRRRNDRQWTMEMVSVGCLALTGHSPEQLHGNAEISYSDIIAAEDREMVWKEVQAALQQRRSFELNYRIHSTNGQAKWVWERGMGIFDALGEIVALEGFITDVTERRQLEEQLRHAQKMEAIGHLAGGVAHDFNNILAAMMMNLSFLERDADLAGESRGYLIELDNGARRAADLTRQLLMFSRRQIMQAKVLDLNELLDNLLKMLRRLLAENINFLFREVPAPLMVLADAGMIEQVVTNLCVNARDAMPNGGTLILSTQQVKVETSQVKHNPEAQAGDWACLCVEDTGCGMDEATLKRIFEPFFTTKDVGKGTGLGLATVHGIIKQHHGWVEVESTAGQGARFCVFLPLVANKAREASADENPTPLHGGSETILLVEDDPGVRRAIAMFLRRQGYMVLEAGSGLEAMTQWEKNQDTIALLYTDMVMPEGMTGVELAGKLRARKPNLRIIISSGYSLELAENTSSSKEDITYLPKPCNPAKLARTIRQVLNQKIDL